MERIPASTPVPRLPRRLLPDVYPNARSGEQPDDLWRAQLVGDRESVRRLGLHLLGFLEFLNDSGYTARCLGAVARAHADSVHVAVFGDLIEWSREVERQIPLIRLQLSDSATGHRVDLEEAVDRLLRSTANLRRDVTSHIRGEWTEPGSLVRTICEIGDLHIAHEVARLMTAHGDAAAGENCRAAIVRQRDNDEALNLTRDLFERNRNDYVCNTRAAVLMDAFHRTGEKAFLDSALGAAWQSLQLTAIAERRSSYTFATTSRVIRAIDTDVAHRVMELSMAAERLYRRTSRECAGTCSQGACICDCDIRELWLIMAGLVARLGRRDIALLVANRIGPDHEAIPDTLRRIINDVVRDHGTDPF